MLLFRNFEYNYCMITQEFQAQNKRNQIVDEVSDGIQSRRRTKMRVRNTFTRKRKNVLNYCHTSGELTDKAGSYFKKCADDEQFFKS